MTRFCAALAPRNAALQVRQMGGHIAHADTRCALGTLPDMQTGQGAGPYVLRYAAATADAHATISGLTAVGQVLLYNRAELLAELARAGDAPPPDCADGDVLLHIYAHAGLAGLQRVRGMFACAIWDGSHLLLVRDAAGTRTLFYARSPQGWAAASSLRALRRWPPLAARVNLAAVRSYLTFAYLPGDETLLDGVSKLLPGHCLRITPDGSCELLTLWEPHEQAYDPDAPPETYAAPLRGLIEQAVAACLPPRQEVAVLLSGGIDSSLVTALAARLHDQPVTTYSIHFGKGHTNELAYAELVATHCGTRHHVLEFNGAQVLAHLPETMARLESPVGDPLTAPNLLMARRAAADGFQHILNGEGGDPCFGGPKNIPMLLFELYRDTPDPTARARAYLRSYRNCYDDLPELLSPQVQAALRDAPPLERLVQPFLEAPAMHAYLNRLLLTNIRTKGAHHILNKVESLSSSCGIVAHSPLFHQDIMDYSFAIPPQMKLAGTTEKWVLKHAVRDVLPPHIVYRPKSGMRVPLVHWLRGPAGLPGPLHTFARQVLFSPSARARGLFREEKLRAWLRDEETLWNRQASKLWLLVTLELWLQSYLDGRDSPAAENGRRWWRSVLPLGHR
jgi:asparagine synthase (glutamine-hydrolysing)